MYYKNQNPFKTEPVNILFCNGVFVLVTHLKANRERGKRIIKRNILFLLKPNRLVLLNKNYFGVF